jgi:hypothetical protein
VTVIAKAGGLVIDKDEKVLAIHRVFVTTAFAFVHHLSSPLCVQQVSQLPQSPHRLSLLDTS